MTTLLSKPRRIRFIVMILLLLTSILLTACGAQATAMPEPAAEPISAPASTEIPATEAPAPVATEAAAPTEPAAPAASAVSFSKDVLPILESRCVSCHGGERTSKGLDLKSYDSLMAGSQNGAVVVAGDAGNSSFVKLIQDGKMPKRGPKLLPEQLQMLIDWVNTGAQNN